MNLHSYQFFKKLCQFPSVEAIWMYGSRARGDHQQRADIDLAMLCPKATNEEWSKVLETIENADTLLKIDCVRFDHLSKNNPLRANILKDKMPVFDRNKETMTKSAKFRENFENLGNALERLNTVLKHRPDPERVYIDATIQRFEFSMELFWKSLKSLIETLGKEVNYPREILQEAYKSKWIDNEKLWLKMLEDRNKTSHTYDQDLADEIYSNIKNTYYPLLHKAYQKLKTRFYKDYSK